MNFNRNIFLILSIFLLIPPLSANELDGNSYWSELIEVEKSKLREKIRSNVENGCPSNENSGEIVLFIDNAFGTNPNSDEDITVFKNAFDFETKEEVKKLFEKANSNGCGNVK